MSISQTPSIYVFRIYIDGVFFEQIKSYTVMDIPKVFKTLTITTNKYIICL